MVKLKIIAICLIGAGAVTLVGGFFYDAICAGIPYQGPTPQLQARYDFHSAIAGILMESGVVILGLGLVLLAIWIVQKRRTA